jgi:benzoyl-CoA reductase/2-hydroxyglutaryl-CoA dehydratase subunit BcrC/BadD/HgdB
VGDVFQRPNDLLYEQVQARIAERHLDGLIVVRTTWCDVWRLACVRLHELVKVPVLEWVMDGQFQGQSFPDGASTTRLEAFCELLRSRREEGA